MVSPTDKTVRAKAGARILSAPESSLAPKLSPLYFLKVFWGFVKSDIFTFVTPGILFGVGGALSPSDIFDGTQSDIMDVMRRLPRVFLFNIFTLLFINMSNQRSPASVLEDTINKPWRPIPSGMITADQTRRICLFLVPFTIGCSYAMGIARECLMMQVLTFYYNDLCGSDEIIRDAIVAAAYAIVNDCSLKLSIGPENKVSARGNLWTATISCVIFTTISAQDLKDQAGDKARQRNTLPLMIGDIPVRLILSLCVPFWSLFCVRFWHVEPGLTYFLPLVLGLLISWRFLMIRTPAGDEKTWKLWCTWHTVLYFIPLARSLPIPQ